MTSAPIPAPAQREPELAGQTVVVIGGSAGTGLETARRARSEGADVILTGVAIYEAVMDVFRFEQLSISTRGLRFAAVMD